MCRLMAYLGAPLSLEQLLFQPPHSLIVQSYQPQEMTAGLLNADGFGLGWYGSQAAESRRQSAPFRYRSILPIWNDNNLSDLARYVQSHCVMASIRSATPGLAVDLSNCQPFQSGQLLAIHNGYIENFRQTLYRPMREKLCDRLYQSIHGTTDSEHLFALILHFFLALSPDALSPDALVMALTQAIQFVFQLAAPLDIKVGANIVLSTGTHLIASRAANKDPVPTLYWRRGDGAMGDGVVGGGVVGDGVTGDGVTGDGVTGDGVTGDGVMGEGAIAGNIAENGVLIASEPLMPGNWHTIPEQSILWVGPDRTVQIQPIPI